ncbi:MAG: AAA family ATPase [Clostridia bacterium]|nr:AAA family ATPase [Clostridia bacterium]
MNLQSLHIASFGGLEDFSLDFADGANILYGKNETGKSSVAAFIKFIFYGLSSRAGKSGVSERARYLNSRTGTASGHLTVRTDDGGLWRIERSLTAAGERIRIIDRSSGEIITGEEPGMKFFGVPEDVFVSTCFVSQVSVRPEAPVGQTGGGAKTAVENLLASADENVDIRRAEKQLDDLRRELSHKNGGGGEIADLKERRAALLAERNSSAARTAELLSLSASLDDIRRRIGELEEDKARHDAIFDALEKITLKRRIDAADEAESQLSRLKSAMQTLAASPFSEGADAILGDSERDIRAYDEQLAAYRERFPGEGDLPADPRPYPFRSAGSGKDEDDERADDGIIPEDGPLPADILSRAKPEDRFDPYEDSNALKMDTLNSVVGDNIPDPIAAIAGVRRLAAKSRGEFVAAIGLAAAAVIGLGISLAFAVNGHPIYPIPLIASLLLMTGAVVAVIRHVGTSSALTESLQEWNAESADEIEFAVRERLHVLERESAQSGERRRMLDSLEAAKLRYGAAVSRVHDLAVRAGIEESDDIYETLSALRQKCAEITSDREQITARRSRLEGRLSVLREQLEDVNISEAELDAHDVLSTEWGRQAAAMTQSDIKALIGEREFTDNALRAAEKRRAGLEEKLAAAGEIERPADELDTLIGAADERIEELSLRHDALELANQAIRGAGEALRRGVIPRIAEAASERVKKASGSYDRMLLDDGFRCSLSDGADVVPQENFSRGTADLAYLSLRLALADEMFRGERPPVILDESFAHIDAERTAGFLSTLTDGGQTIVLTCRRDEAEAGRRLGQHVITMGT